MNNPARLPRYRTQPTTRRAISRLKLLRVRRQISAATLAYAAGIPVQLVEKYEEGRVRIPVQHRGRLAYALNVGIEDIPERENLYPVQMPPEAVEGWAWVRNRRERERGRSMAARLHRGEPASPVPATARLGKQGSGMSA